MTREILWGYDSTPPSPPKIRLSLVEVIDTRGGKSTGRGGVSRGVWTRKLPITEHRTRIGSPVLIGVVADTHGSPTRAGGSLDLVVEFFRRMRVGLILHAGDAGHASVLQNLEQVAPTVAVRGNADPLDLIEALPDRVWIEVGSRTLLLMHGHHGRTALKAARAAAAPGTDLIVFGHSHKPLIEQEGGTILFNPGSPTERRWNPHFGVGLIGVSDAELEPELVLFDDARHLANIDS
jgi:putative phosphoesterase